MKTFWKVEERNVGKEKCRKDSLQRIRKRKENKKEGRSEQERKYMTDEFFAIGREKMRREESNRMSEKKQSKAGSAWVMLAVEWG